ncbi:MAG TPA: hypothetical protein VKI19_10655, partial [Acidimicrobiales bacterium]|nr:hypothetical protein [Acidimicrobiales bacterium]
RLPRVGAMVGIPAVSACPTIGTWKPGPDQPATASPGYSCRSGHQADGRLSAADESWAVPVGWAAKGVVSVALVPTPGTKQPFSADYTAPSRSSLTIDVPPAGSGSGTTVPTTVPTAPSTVPVGSPAGSPAAGGAPGPGSGAGTDVLVPATVGPPSASGAPAGGTGGPPPALGGIPSNAGGPTAVAAPASAAPGGGTGKPGGTGRAPRIMAVGLLVATGLALFRLAAQPVRAPRSLLRGALPGEVAVAVSHPVRGIGRFARPRPAPPKRI